MIKSQNKKKLKKVKQENGKMVKKERNDKMVKQEKTEEN